MLMQQRIDDIRNNGACRRQIARAAPVEHHIAHGVAAHADRIIHILHAVQRVFRGNDERGNHQQRFFIHLLVFPDEANGAAEAFRRIHIVFRDAFNALCQHKARVKQPPARKRRQNNDLTAGIDSLDIRRRVALRIPEALRLGERFVKSHTL